MFIERQECGLLSAGSADQHVAVNQRRFGIGPFTVFTAKVATQVFLPTNIPIGGFQTNQISVRTERIDQLPVDRRRGPGARIRWLLLGMPHVSEPPGPDWLTIRRIERLNKLVLQTLAADEINATIDDGRSGITSAKLLALPQKRGPFFGPLLPQPRFLRKSIAPRSAP